MSLECKRWQDYELKGRVSMEADGRDVTPMCRQTCFSITLLLAVTSPMAFVAGVDFGTRSVRPGCIPTSRPRSALCPSYPEVHPDSAAVAVHRELHAICCDR